MSGDAGGAIGDSGRGSGDAGRCDRTPEDRRDEVVAACQVCLVPLVRVKLKWVCPRCGTIHETCCEGDRTG